MPPPKTDPPNARAERAEKRFQLVVEAAANGIVMADAAGTILLVNSQVEQMFGYRRDELVGQPVEVLIPERLRGRHPAHRESFARRPEKRHMGAGRDLLARRKDGSEFPVEIGLTPTGTGAEFAVVAVITDITEQWALKHAILEASEREQRRIGRDLHDDLCQQLAGVGCLAELAAQRAGESGDPGLAELVGGIAAMVTQANVRAREIARGLLPVILESDGLMAGLAELAAGLERVYQLECRATGSAEVGRETAVQLYRIAQEAASNAVRHGGARRVEIVVSDDAHEVRLTVCDDGSGIGPAALEERAKGGMGLVTMEQRARILAGRFTVRAPAGGGTEVAVVVPKKRDREGRD